MLRETLRTEQSRDRLGEGQVPSGSTEVYGSAPPTPHWRWCLKGSCPFSYSRVCSRALEEYREGRLAGSVGAACDSASQACEFKPHTACTDDLNTNLKKCRGNTMPIKDNPWSSLCGGQGMLRRPGAEEDAGKPLLISRPQARGRKRQERGQRVGLFGWDARCSQRQELLTPRSLALWPSAGLGQPVGREPAQPLGLERATWEPRPRVRGSLVSKELATSEVSSDARAASLGMPTRSKESRGRSGQWPRPSSPCVVSITAGRWRGVGARREGAGNLVRAHSSSS